MGLMWYLRLLLLLPLHMKFLPRLLPPTPNRAGTREEGTHTEGVSETTPIPAETLNPPERVISPATIQTKATSPLLPLVISTSDPFALS